MLLWYHYIPIVMSQWLHSSFLPRYSSASISSLLRVVQGCKHHQCSCNRQISRTYCLNLSLRPILTNLASCSQLRVNLHNRSLDISPCNPWVPLTFSKWVSKFAKFLFQHRWTKPEQHLITLHDIQCESTPYQRTFLAH